jgi:membrane protease YdiL (CAAX protease family)
MAAWPIKPGEPVTPSSQAGAVRAPGVLYALGLILLYFLLQLAAGALVSFAASLFEGFRYPQLSHADIHQHVMNLLQRPDSNAMLVIIALPLIALMMLIMVRRAWPALWLLSRPPGFGLTAPSASSWYVLGLLVGLVMPPLGGILTQWLAHGHEVTQNVEELSRHASSNLRLPLAMVAVSVGPMIEELLFRGVLLSALMRRLSTGLSVAICAVLFGVVHLGGLDFEWYALPNLILLAAALCWLRLKSASLWPAILAHSIYNLFALIALFAAT